MKSNGKTKSLRRMTCTGKTAALVKTSEFLALAFFFVLLAHAAAQDPALVAKAQAGDANAQDSLGDFYYAKGTPQDYTKAAAWYLKSADQGDPKAQYSLGISYCWHYGVPMDYSQAYFWVDLAIDGGIKDKNHWLDYAASHLTPAEVTQAQQKAQEWLKSHPEKTAP